MYIISINMNIQPKTSGLLLQIRILRPDLNVIWTALHPLNTLNGKARW